MERKKCYPCEGTGLKKRDVAFVCHIPHPLGVFSCSCCENANRTQYVECTTCWGEGQLPEDEAIPSEL